MTGSLLQYDPLLNHLIWLKIPEIILGIIVLFGSIIPSPSGNFNVYGQRIPKKNNIENASDIKCLDIFDENISIRLHHPIAPVIAKRKKLIKLYLSLNKISNLKVIKNKIIILIIE